MSNVVSPSEFAEMYRLLREQDGVTHIDQVVPGLIARVAGVAPEHAEHGKGSPHTMMPGTGINVRLGDEGVSFLGLFFRMTPDPSMVDGDRCVFLRGDTAGEFACRWHGTNAQPSQCALAPFGFNAPLLKEDPPKFMWTRSRFRWCEGMRNSRDGLAPRTSVRAILDANDGWRRMEEFKRFDAALEESRNWRRGFRNHHSPLARLYIESEPDLEQPLLGY